MRHTSRDVFGERAVSKKILRAVLIAVFNLFRTVRNFPNLCLSLCCALLVVVNLFAVEDPVLKGILSREQKDV